jgi:putative solute:sodium symporter small subunit
MGRRVYPRPCVLRRAFFWGGSIRSILDFSKLTRSLDRGHNAGPALVDSYRNSGAQEAATISMQWGENMKSPQGYWKANLRILLACLVVWFVVSYGFGILLGSTLNQIQIAGFRLGFWFAQQGSIYVFVALIFFYVWRMNRLDREYDVHED